MQNATGYYQRLGPLHRADKATCRRKSFRKEKWILATKAAFHNSQTVQFGLFSKSSHLYPRFAYRWHGYDFFFYNSPYHLMPLRAERERRQVYLVIRTHISRVAPLKDALPTELQRRGNQSRLTSGSSSSLLRSTTLSTWTTHLLPTKLSRNFRPPELQSTAPQMSTRLCSLNTALVLSEMKDLNV